MHKRCEKILKELEKDGHINVWWEFQFPKPFDNGLRLRDVLENEVDEKYYINQDKANALINKLKDKDAVMLDMCQAKREGSAREYTDFAPTLSARDYKEPRLINVGNLNPTQINHGQIKFKEDDICSCIDANYYKGLDNHATRTGVLQVNTSDDGEGSRVMVVGKINSSQDGIVVNPDGISPTHTAGHGNCPKVLVSNQNEILQVGMLDIKGNEQVRRVYDPEGISPTLNTMQGGNRQPKIIEDFYSNRDVREYKDYSPTLRADRQGLKVVEENGVGIIDDQGRINKELNIKDYCPTLRAESHGNLPKVIQGCSTRTRNYVGQPEQLEVRKDEVSNSVTTVAKDSMVLESTSECNKEFAVLCPKRTEYGKTIRKQYEAGKIQESRHNMTELQPREDGVSNTLTTVQKDNLVLESRYRIRKLTPKECWRLMGFSDEEFERAKWHSLEESRELSKKSPKRKWKRSPGNQEIIERMSNSQLYKQAGNSIVVDVLYYIYIELYRAMPYLFDDLRLGSFFSGIGAFESALDRLYETI